MAHAHADVATTPAPARWRARLRGPGAPVMLAFLFWAILASMFASQHAFSAWFNDKTFSLLEIFKHQLLGLGPWVVLTPVIYHVAARIPPTAPNRVRNLKLHVLAATVCVFVHATLAIGAAYVLTPELIKEPLPEHFSRYIGGSYGFSILLYVVIVFLFYLTQYAAVLSERDVERAELRERLAKAQLEALQLQLQPHFLFNTLNTISALIHENPDGADQMIDQLSEFLRIVLKNAHGDPITLGEELRVLSVYLSIQQTRFRSRLRFDIMASDDVTNCLVPSLLLQPLVENAVKHGLSARGHGTVRILARRVEGRLQIQVSDDGVAGAVGEARGTGLGLANTRARLQHFYGDSFDLALVRKPHGGTVVTIRIPCRSPVRSPRVLMNAERYSSAVN